LDVTRRHWTTAEKRDVIAALLKDMPERSDRETAELVGVDNKTVGSVRRHLEALGELMETDEVYGRDGRIQSTVRRRVRSPDAPKLSSPSEKLKAENARLQEELDAANAKIRRLERAEGDMLLISRKDTAEAILAVLESEIPTKAGRIAALLLNRQKSTAPRPAKVLRGVVR
jgi:hypothetical protein